MQNNLSTEFINQSVLKRENIYLFIFQSKFEIPVYSSYIPNRKYKLTFNSKGCDSDLSWYFYERTAICFLYLFYDLFIIDGWRAR